MAANLRDKSYNLFLMLITCIRLHHPFKQDELKSEKHIFGDRQNVDSQNVDSSANWN